ncbi:hypothetical protein COU96_02250 [Candidatus Shapirobacteria bacterium CG10_big_fil_rev_8_21_14_0_10_38_14]|uniref:Uncharacterized protein n=1 Tax=Candidatus Shapirobacteria bacterium CG10_big_fil_rev_8_21_14_0_10_38_14 TaxID=1974483 RepID=A0A2M8L580_9BACT|nr:MAG: hypothetical protein COU96_02250 [Candidatus Shapirobacteria bacterium CG10_big_fil_rev_8_21_14_0_10_38_14]
MVKLPRKTKVYSEFFTNGAVAWFSAGVIAPLFTKKLSLKEILASLIAIISCFLFLKLTTLFNKEG